MTAQNGELLPEYRVIFIWDDNDTDNADNTTLDWMIETMRLTDKDLISRLVYDDKNPDYVIASDKYLYADYVINGDKALKTLKRYLKKNKESVFIFFTYEGVEPDLNIFDYAFTWNPDLVCGDRIGHNFSYMYDFRNEVPYTNTLTRDEARKLLADKRSFCVFMYSHKSEPRDSVFHLLSEYKRVDSTGSYLHNTDTKPSRNQQDWYELSVEIKSGYKFSIAMENATYKGYTSEKLIASLRAHTVPIYWGDPAVTDYINPKAFINVSDYSSLDEVLERVKEIDNNDELWLDMVTQPWQTEEQRARTLQGVADYNSFFRNIFSQDIKKAKRVLRGMIGDRYRRDIRAMVVPCYVRLFRRTRGKIAKYLPRRLKDYLKKILHYD